MQLGKEYLNALLCKFVTYSLQHSETFDVSHVFLTLTIAELSTLKQVRFFLAHPVSISLSQQRNPSCECKNYKTILVLAATTSLMLLNLAISRNDT